eukprot:Tamp_01532.p3 GENE.Tamp_01532~~Tamp_01532.p3  ORF type:complete len:351 (-),score=47.41 Tamp_01532:4194-5171(-)
MAQPSDAASAAGPESARVNPARSKKPPSPQTLDDIFHDCDVMTVVQPVLWWLGTYLRFKAILNDEYREPIAARVEVVTPITDFARVREGVFLWMHGASPYAGDTLHLPPLLLVLLAPLAGTPPPVWCLSFFFVLIQLLTAAMVYQLALQYHHSVEVTDACFKAGLAEGDEEEELKDFARAALDPDLVDTALVPPEKMTMLGRDSTGVIAAFMFWLNPFSILTCAGLSTLVIEHLFLLAAILAGMQGRLRAAGMSMALNLLMSPYNLTLLPAVVLLLNRSHRQHAVSSSLFMIAKWTMILFAACCGIMATIVPPERSWEVQGDGLV